MAAAWRRARVAGDARGDPRRRAPAGRRGRGRALIACIEAAQAAAAERREIEVAHGPLWRGDICRPASGGLVVSCQPVPGARSTAWTGWSPSPAPPQSAGARGLRIEGVRECRGRGAGLDLPVIGLVKRDLPDSPVRITQCSTTWRPGGGRGRDRRGGCHRRPRPVPVAELLGGVRGGGALAMADCATLAEAGRPSPPAPTSSARPCRATPAGRFRRRPTSTGPGAARLGVPVLAEGRYNTPALAAEAIRAGATAVVVGSAITRPEHVTAWFRAAVDAAARRPARCWPSISAARRRWPRWSGAARCWSVGRCRPPGGGRPGLDAWRRGPGADWSGRYAAPPSPPPA